MAATAAAPLQQHKPQPLETFQSGGNFQTFTSIRSTPLSFHMTPTARPATSSTGGSGNFGSSGSGNWGSMGSVKVTPTSGGVNPTGSFRLSPNSNRRWVENTPVAATPVSLWPPTPSPSGFTHVTTSIQHPAVSSGYTVVQHQPQGGGADSGPKLPVSSQATVITTQAPTETTTTTTAAPAPATGAAPQMMQPMVFISMPVPMPQQGQVVMQMPQMQQVPMQGVQGVQGVQGQPMMVMAPQPAAATVQTLQAVPEASHGVSTSIATAPGSAISPKPAVVTTMTRTVVEAPPVTIASSSMNVEGGATAPAMSLGSSLHSVGKCSPCAWYWKPKGCSVGANCDFCHLCPKGELNARKKAKVAAMRMGLIPPGTRAAPRVA